MSTRSRDKMTKAQRQWDTIARHNYQPWPPGLNVYQRQAIAQKGALTHALAYFTAEAAENYRTLTGRDDAPAVAALIRQMQEQLDAVAKSGQRGSEYGNG